MVRLERETQDLRETVFHIKQPHYNAENAQHARFPGEPQSCLPIRVNLSEAIAQPLPYCGHSHLIATADLRYIGLTPQPATHESRRNPGGFHTAVLDMGWPS